MYPHLNVLVPLYSPIRCGLMLCEVMAVSKRERERQVREEKKSVTWHLTASRSSSHHVLLVFYSHVCNLPSHRFKGTSKNIFEGNKDGEVRRSEGQEPGEKNEVPTATYVYVPQFPRVNSCFFRRWET